MMTSIKEKLGEYNYQLMMCSGETDNLGYPDYISYYLEKRIGGIIYVADAYCRISYEERQLIEKYRVPTVIIDSDQDYEGVGNLKLDYYHSIYHFLEVILQKKCYERILCLSPDEAYYPEKNWEYQNAIRDFSADHKIPFLICNVMHIDACDQMDQTTFDNGFIRWISVYNQVEHYLEKWRENDLIFCVNGFLAESVLAIIKKRELCANIALGEEFMTIPIQWIDYLKHGGEVFINNLNVSSNVCR